MGDKLPRDDEIYIRLKNKKKKQATTEIAIEEEEKENPKLLNLFEKFVGLKSYLMKNQKIIAHEKKNEKEYSQKKQEKNKQSEKKKSEDKRKKGFKILNICLSLIFLTFTIVSVFIQKPQDFSYFITNPIIKLLNSRQVPIFLNFHRTVMDDILQRYDFAFNFYRSLINKQPFNDDLVPVSTFRVSITRTQYKDCESIFANFTTNITKGCSENLYIADSLYPSDFFTTLESNDIESLSNTTLTYNVFDVDEKTKNFTIQQVSTMEYVSAMLLWYYSKGSSSNTVRNFSSLLFF